MMWTCLHSKQYVYFFHMESIALQCEAFAKHSTEPKQKVSLSVGFSEQITGYKTSSFSLYTRTSIYDDVLTVQ